LASAAPVRWALAQLDQALTHAGYTVQHRENISQAGADEPTVMIAGSSSPGAVAALQRARIEAPRSPETLAIANTSASGRSAVLGLILATTIVRRFSRLPIWPYLTPIPSRIARRRRSSIWKRP
jgi:hypothetical protein